MKVLHSICTIFAPMKARNILILILGTLILPIYLTSCGVDRWKEYAGQTQTDRWIDDTMRVWYYWVDAIPHTNDLNYFQAPFTFFASLKSEEDKFSTIDSLVSVTTTRSIPYTDYSYGFQFTTNQIEVEGEENAIVAQILYVADGSPASEIGLKRGDWIMKMDGNFITEQNYKKLYGSSAMELTVGYYDVEKNAIVAYDKPRQIASARPVNDNPVHYKNVYTSGSKKIGYLVYNHFSSGPTDNSNEYDNDLRSAFQYFASQQVNEFILDLRYNNGITELRRIAVYHACTFLRLGTRVGVPGIQQPLQSADSTVHPELRTHRKRSKPKPEYSLRTYQQPDCLRLRNGD